MSALARCDSYGCRPLVIESTCCCYLQGGVRQQQRYLFSSGPLEGFADSVHLETQVTGPVEGMGGLLTRAELRLYVLHLQEVAQQVEQAAAAIGQQQPQAPAGLDASSWAAGAAAAGAAGAAAAAGIYKPGFELGAGLSNLAPAAAAAATTRHSSFTCPVCLTKMINLCLKSGA